MSILPGKGWFYVTARGLGSKATKAEGRFVSSGIVSYPKESNRMNDIFANFRTQYLADL